MAYKCPIRIMRKQILYFFLMLFPTFSFAQYITVEELNKALDKGITSDLNSVANSIMQELPLDEKGGFTYVKVVEAPNKTKDQLYIILNAWFLRKLDGKGIQINDKEIGCIMAKELFRKMASNGSFPSSNTNYEVDIEPIIRADIKEGKVRITYNVPHYELRDVTSAVWGRQVFKKDKSRSLSFSESYPYNPKGKEKKMMTRALVFTHYLSGIMVNDIERTIKEGMTGNEADDDW